MLGVQPTGVPDPKIIKVAGAHSKSFVAISIPFDENPTKISKGKKRRCDFGKDAHLFMRFVISF